MLTIAHRGGTYPVRLEPLPQAVERLPRESVVITDTDVDSLYGSLVAGFPKVVVAAGETSKTIATFAEVVSRLAELGANRKAVVVALGGGVVGDLVGYVAASYMRGVRLVQIPTTLLAQVDSAVGGKVGVDLPEGKNLVGAFKTPDWVSVPIEALQTLPARQFANGMAEVAKYGFIMDAELAAQLGRSRLGPDAPQLTEVVQRCIAHKARVVEDDEFETTGRRAILNFGHTIGHAIELATGFGPILHGEAIAVGMRLEAELSERLSLAPKGLSDEVERVLGMQGLATRCGLDLDPTLLMEAMRRDKKSSGEGLAFSLLTAMGSCKLVTGVSVHDVAPLLADL